MQNIGLSPYTIIGMVIVLVLGVSSLVLTGMAIRERLRQRGRRWYDRKEGWAWAAGIAGLVSAIFIPIIAIAAVPYDPSYWSWYKAEGVVTSVDSRTVAEAFVVTVEGVDEPLRVMDPRVINLEGERAAFVCDREWVSFGQGADRFNCNIAEVSN